MKTCYECAYCLKEEFGYSNYTTEGIEVYCLKNLNPELPKDAWYGEEPALEFADECEGFVKGDPVHIDCEREEVPYEIDGAYSDCIVKGYGNGVSDAELKEHYAAERGE